MILILSHDQYEQGTEGVIDWLLHQGYPFLRASANSLMRPDTEWEINVHDGHVRFQGVDLQEEVGCVFYRRFDPYTPFHETGNIKDSLQLRQELQGEAERLTGFLADSLADKFWLPTIAAAKQAANKLSTLPLARTCGLAVPRSFICRTRAEVKALFASSKLGWITKPIEYCGYYSRGDQAYTTFTTRLEAEQLHELPTNFYPSLLQERITAHREIRSFYLMGEFFSEAILSAGNTTELNDHAFADIKLCDLGDRATYVPYQLPETVEEKLDRLMRRLNLNTGSIDLMVTEDGEYYFLEVNPCGQFSAPSERANFQLEKRVAEALIQKDQYYARQTTKRPLSQLV